MAAADAYAFDQRRRHAEDVGVVVEPGCRIVRRQHRADIDVEREQIANDVGVLGAIQPVQGRRAGIGLQRRGAIELRLRAPT